MRFPHLGFRTAYRGDPYSGSQLQLQVPTVQGQMEKALSIYFRTKIRLRSTSRTDAGVHAYEQIFVWPDGAAVVASLSPAQQKRLLISLNALLGGSVVVWELMKLRKDFNPKLHTEWKEYRYRIFQSRLADPLQDPNMWWIRTPLNLAQVKEFCLQITGEHDFAAFSKFRSLKQLGSRGSRRRILLARVHRHRHSIWPDAYYWEFRIRGDGFLHQMVRGLVGAMVAYSSGGALDFQKMLSGKTPEKLVKVAPALGLCLIKTKLRAGFSKRITL